MTRGDRTDDPGTTGRLLRSAGVRATDPSVLVGQALDARELNATIDAMLADPDFARGYVRALQEIVDDLRAEIDELRALLHDRAF